MAASAQGPVAEAVIALLVANSALVAALAAGSGLCGEIPDSPTLPLLWVEIFNEVEQRGFGTGGLPEIELRTHAFTARGATTGGMAQAREINRLTIAALKDQALTIAGYAHCGRIFSDQSTALPDEELLGVKVHEVVSMFRIYAEEV